LGGGGGGKSKSEQHERDRVATILVYLEDTPVGGETFFPKLGDGGLFVRPKRGSALLFNNMDGKSGNCLADSMHEATPVGRSTEDPWGDDDDDDADGDEDSGDYVSKPSKTILQRFYYYSSFPNLGVRVREPELPARKPGQFKVACDGISSSSYCRLYNEWGYDTLVSYRQKFGFDAADERG
jgi:hypothetical protein